jgi:hypothetical protein
MGGTRCPGSWRRATTSLRLPGFRPGWPRSASGSQCSGDTRRGARSPRLSGRHPDLSGAEPAAVAGAPTLADFMWRGAGAV